MSVRVNCPIYLKSKMYKSKLLGLKLNNFIFINLPKTWFGQIKFNIFYDPIKILKYVSWVQFTLYIFLMFTNKVINTDNN